LMLTQRMLAASFYAPVRFKANSSAQEAVAQRAGIAPLTQAALIDAQPYLPLNQSEAVGRLRIVGASERAPGLTRDDIVVLRDVPLSLPPVAGVLTERPSTALSHVNLLAKGWGIPNAYVRDAAQAVLAWDGQWVHLRVSASGYTLRAATDAERSAAGQARAAQASRPSRLTAKPDLARTALAPLSALRVADRQRCGAKAAHLGALRAAGIAGTVVPDGFCIPFAAYAQFSRQHGLAQRVAQMRARPGFEGDAGLRRQALAELRGEMAQWPLPSDMAEAWTQRWTQQLNGAGVFVRSSSNSEDLPHFSGAGLYTTVPHVRTAQGLAVAVRQVWASLYNFEAWEARRAAGLDEQQWVMGVLVQQAVDASASGVMVTRDPFDARRRQVSYIAAKRGLGIRVVDGQRVAEQVLVHARSGAVQVISRSADEVALQLDPAGGVREVAVSAGRAVLTDAVAQRLAGVGAAIRRQFGGRDQDIEWALLGEQIVILQARPFVDD
ncbi:MAG: pyruvate, phosphate dikinase, partial [Comamonadaceae bacterium]